MASGTISGTSSAARRSSSIARTRCDGWTPDVTASTRAERSMRSPASRKSSPLHLFLYGTLMRGQPAHHLFAPRATFVDDASVAGMLLDLGKFPGMIAGRGRVRGEVWRL